MLVGGKLRLVAVAGAAALAFGVVSATTGANPGHEFASNGDFRAAGTVDVNDATSTILLHGTLARYLVEGDYLVKVRVQFDVEQQCVAADGSGTPRTATGSFNSFSFEVVTNVSQPSLADHGNRLPWTAEVSFTNPLNAVPGFYDFCPEGFVPVDLPSTAPVFHVTGATVNVWPSFQLASSPPSTKHEQLLLSVSVPAGTTRIHT